MQRFSTGDQTLLREINLSSVLRYLHRNTHMSRAQLATVTGLNKSTVSSLVDELLERQLVCETGLEASSTGRPATLLVMNPEAGCIIGVEFGVDFVTVILSNFTGQVLWRCKQDADPSEGQDATANRVFKLVDQAIIVSQAKEARLLGLGIATPGTVNVEDGLLIFAPNLHWHNAPLGRIFQTRYPDIPVFVDNDANAAAIGEHLFGVARSAQNFVVVFAGVGIGGGLFLNGDLYRGKSGYAGEIGHSLVMVESYQPPCHCGNRGCWETYANQYSIVERVRDRLHVQRSSLIPALMGEQNTGLTISIIIQAAEYGDPEAIEALSEAGLAMGMGIANIINIFNPELVVIAGPLSAAGDFLLPSIKDSIQKHTLPEILAEAEIVSSAFGPDASVIGAIAMVVEAILSKPTRVDRMASLKGQNQGQHPNQNQRIKEVPLPLIR
jgi:glucokinase-like ROK family protein